MTKFIRKMEILPQRYLTKSRKLSVDEQIQLSKLIDYIKTKKMPQNYVKLFVELIKLYREQKSLSKRAIEALQIISRSLKDG